MDIVCRLCSNCLRNFVQSIHRYIDIVAGLAINEAGHIVAVDSVSPTVFRITENGDLIKWFDVSDRMREPSDLAIHGKEYYICDFKVTFHHPILPVATQTLYQYCTFQFITRTRTIYSRRK